MTERAEKIHKAVQKNKKQFLELLEALVKAESPTSDPGTLEKPFSILTDAFEKICFKVTRIPGDTSGGQLFIRPKEPQNGKFQLMIGHCDTVWPIGTIEEMPFKMEGNNVSGPGTYDMKAGLCMIYLALKVLQETGIQPELTPVIFINSDEETGSADSENRIKVMARHSERVFVLEPALGIEGKIKTRRKGVGHFEITVKGKPSHAGLEPEKGISAILGLSHIVQQLFRLNEPEKGISVNVGTIEGGERSNVVAAKSKASVDVRVPTIEDGERIENTIYNLEPEIPGIELEVTGEIGKPPLMKTAQNEKLWKMTKKLGRELDLKLEEGISGGASDGNVTSLYAPTLDGLGAVGEGAHAYHEKIFLKETLQRCTLLALLLAEPCSLE